MNYSPLRYPGGKSKIAPFIKLLMENSPIDYHTYIEPFAGGAGVALTLLLEDVVDRIVINDYDKAIYSFWRAVKENTNALIRLVRETPLTIAEWKKQKQTYLNSTKYSIELGFAAFYLNRTNRSGILKAGPIGGLDQSGNYLIDARFNREVLIDKIAQIAKRKKDISVYNQEIRSFITNILPRNQKGAVVYFDPPYYKKGKELYKNFFDDKDHEEIRNSILSKLSCEKCRS